MRRTVLTIGLVLLGATMLVPAILTDLDRSLALIAFLFATLVTSLAWFERAQPFLDRFDWLLASPIILAFIASSGGATSPHRPAWLVIAVYAAAFLPAAEFGLAVLVTAGSYFAPALYGDVPAGWVETSLVEVAGYAMVVLLVRLLAVRSDRLLETVQQQENEFLALFDDHPLPMLVLDGDGIVVRANREARRVTAAVAPLVDRPLRDTIGVPAELAPALDAALEGEGTALDLPVRLDGEDRTFETTVVPAVPSEGTVRRIFVIGRDVTAERRARAAILRRSEQRTALAELGMDAVMGTPLDELLERAAQLVSRSLPTDNASVMVPREGGMVIQAYTGADPETWHGRWLPVEGSLGGYVFSTGQPLVSNDFRFEQRFPVPDWLRASPARSGLAVVIHTREGRWGVLAAASHEPRPWTNDDLTFVQSVANVIGATVERRAVERRLRESEARFRRMADNAQDIVFRADVDPLRLVYVSPAVEDLLGASPDELLDEPDVLAERLDPMLLAEELPDGPAPVAEAARERLPFRHRDGHVIWLEVHRTPVTDDHGRTIAIEGIARDVTSRRRAQELLEESLLQEQQAADELRRIDDMKDNFLAAVSHELRTPLASVLGFALTIEQSRTQLTDEQLGVLSRRLSSNAQKLDRLLTDLLDLDRMRRSVLEPALRVVDLGDLVERVADAYQSERRRLVVDVRPLSIAVDPPMVERIVENLVGNAIKHTAEDRTIWVRVEREEAAAVITVEDDGAGIPIDLQDLVFAPFEQGPHDHPHAPGTGIGLSLVARFAELHGGEAWVTDRPGGGASFKVRLPLSVAAMEDPADAASGGRRDGPTV